LVTWLSIALRSAVPLRLPTQGGCCECQARAWPRSFAPRLVAKLAIWSPALKLKTLFCGSVASHFISFSGVNWLNSRPARVV